MSTLVMPSRCGHLKVARLSCRAGADKGKAVQTAHKAALWSWRQQGQGSADGTALITRLMHAARGTQEDAHLTISLSQRQQLISGSLYSAKPPPMIARGCWLCYFWRSGSAICVVSMAREGDPTALWSCADRYKAMQMAHNLEHVVLMRAPRGGPTALISCTDKGK